MADPAKPYKPPYPFSITIGAACARQMRTFQDLAEKLKMPVEDLMRHGNGMPRRPKPWLRVWHENWKLMRHS